MPSPYGGLGQTSTAYHGSDIVVTETGPSQPLDFVVNASSNGANVIVAPVVGRLIRVLSYVAVAASTVSATWESSGGTLKSGAMPFAANSGVSAPFSPVGHFDTLTGEGLTLFLSGAVLVAGHGKYVLV